MEEIDIETLANDLVSGELDNETYNQVIEKIETNQPAIESSDIDATANLFIIWWFMGILWFSYWVYGKKSEKIMPYVSGLGMMLIPYFVYDFKSLIGISIGLIILPFLVKV